MQPTSPFSPNDLDVTLSDVGASALLMQLAGEALSLQPPVSVDSVPTLPADQQAVQQVALSGIGMAAQLLALSAVVLGYANKFLAMYDDFLTLAQQIDDPATDPATRLAATNSFVQGLNSLLRTVEDDLDSLNVVTNELATLAAAAIPAQAAMDADLLAVQNALADTEIPALETQLQTIQQTIDADNKIIAKATLHDLVDGGKMVIAIYKMGDEELKDGLKSLVGAVQDIAATTNAIQQATQDVTQQLTLYQQTLEQLTADQLTWAVVQSFDANTDLMVVYLTDATNALAAFKAAWQAQYDGLKTLADTLSAPQSPQPTLTDYLTPDVQDDWITLQSKAIAMQVMPMVLITTVSTAPATNSLAV